MTITGYELSRQWFDFSYDNVDKVTPTHSALYFFITDQCNRRGWPPMFGLPTYVTMDCIGVKNYRTYKKAIDDLEKWGFVKVYEKSKNQHSANIVGLVKNTKATTKALSKATQEQDPKQVQSIAAIIKQVNLETSKQETAPVGLPDFLKYAYEKIFQLKKIKGEVFEELLTSKYLAWSEAGWKKQNEHGDLLPILNWKSTLLNVIPHFRVPDASATPSKTQEMAAPPRKGMCDNLADYDEQWAKYIEKYPNTPHTKE